MPVIVPRPFAEMKRLYAEECHRLAVAADTLYRRDLHSPAYVYGRRQTGIDSHNPAAGIWCELAVLQGPAPDGWERVSGAPLSYAKTVEHQAADIADLLKREPLWIFAD